jgi:methionyl-tRNA formyltransferase
MTKLKIVFMGTPRFAVPTLEALCRAHDVAAVYTREPKPAGRRHALAKSPVHVFAEERAIPVFTPKNFKDAGTVEELEELKPDMIVVFAYGRILPKGVLDIPPMWPICVHPSLLPLYRGANPIQRAIMNGDAATGITLIRMDAGMDTGDMLVKERFAIPPDATTGDMEALIGARAPSLVLDYIGEREQVQPEPQPERFTLATKLAPGEERIDWSRTADEIRNLIRACVPSPKAFFIHRGNMIKALESEVAGAASGSRPGAVLDEALAVACGNGTSIRLLRVQKAGGKSMPARDFLNGYKIAAGEIFE